MIDDFKSSPDDYISQERNNGYQTLVLIDSSMARDIHTKRAVSLYKNSIIKINSIITRLLSAICYYKLRSVGLVPALLLRCEKATICIDSSVHHIDGGKAYRHSAAIREVPPKIIRDPLGHSKDL